MQKQSTPKIIIVGGGFGGVRAAKQLCSLGYHPTLVSASKDFVFLPLLPEVASGVLKPTDIAYPYTSCLNKTTPMVYGSATNLNLTEQSLTVGSRHLPFDYLILASGAKPLTLFPEADAYNLNNINSAEAIKKTVLHSLQIKKNLTVSIIGGGPTGLELAFALARLGQAPQLNILLFTRNNTLDQYFGAGTNTLVDKLLTKAGVKQAGGATKIVGRRITDSQGKIIDSDLIVIASGVVPNTDWLPSELLNDRGCVKVDEYLRAEKFPNIFAIGDIISIKGQSTTKLAQTAVSQAVVASFNIKQSINHQPLKAYHQKIKGVFLSLGHGHALGVIGSWRWQGPSAWFIWRSAYLLNIFGYANKIKTIKAWFKEFFSPHHHTPSS